MMLLSVNIGRPRDVMWNGQIVQTGIFKEPISGSVNLGALILKAISRPICPFTVAHLKPYMFIPESTTTIGATSSPIKIFLSGYSAKTLRPGV